MENLLDYFYKNKDTFIVNPDMGGRDLYVIKYMHNGIDWTKPWALDARGLVINGEGTVISRPYRKFFGYKQLELREDQPESIRALSNWSEGLKYDVTEKLDGSLVIISWYEGDLLITSSGSSTNGYIDAFTKWLKENLTDSNMEVLKDLAKEYTLMFEYVGPSNRIVVSYKKTRIVFHGMVETDTAHNVVDRGVLESVARSIGVDIAKKFDYTLEDLIRLQETQKGVEGYVVTFETGHRLKFKTAEYVELHSEADLFFGRVLTNRKLDILINLCEEDELDDIIAEAERRENYELIEVAMTVEALYIDVGDKLVQANRIVNMPNFSRKHFVATYGTTSIQSLLVLAIANEKYSTLTKIMKKYVKKNVLLSFKEMEEL